MIFRIIVARIVLAFVGVLVCACAAWWFWFRSALPSTIPSDFSLEWRSGGGDSPTSDDVLVDGTSVHAESYRVVNGASVKTERDSSLSTDQLNTLYSFLRAHRADVMMMTEKQSTMVAMMGIG